MTFGFWTSLPLDNITLSASNMKTDQSLSDFETGIGAAAHATFDTKQLISHIGTALADSVTPLQGCDGEVIPVPEVHE